MSRGSGSGLSEKSEATTKEPVADSAGSKAAARTKAKPKSLTPDQLAARGATLLRLGQNLEKSGKSAAALKQYQQVVKDCPNTPAARTASERIKSLGTP